MTNRLSRWKNKEPENTARLAVTYSLQQMWLLSWPSSEMWCCVGTSTSTFEGNQLPTHVSYQAQLIFVIVFFTGSMKWVHTWNCWRGVKKIKFWNQVTSHVVVHYIHICIYIYIYIYHWNNKITYCNNRNINCHFGVAIPSQQITICHTFYLILLHCVSLLSGHGLPAASIS